MADIDQAPPPIDSSMQGSPAYQAQQVAQIASGGTTPTAPAAAPAQPAGSPDMMSMLQQLFQLPQYAQPRSELDVRNQELGALQQQQANMPLPATGPKNLVLRILAGTRPGAAISNAVYSPGIERYQVQRQNLADQIKTAMDRVGISKDELQNVGQTAGTAALSSYRTGELDIQGQRNEIAKQKSDTYAQSVANRNADMLVKQAQGWGRLSVDQQKQKAQQWFQQALIDTSGQRIAAGMDENSARIQAQEDIRTAMSQNDWIKQHPWLNVLGMTPDTAGITAPASAQAPQVTPKPTTKNSPAKPQGKGKVLVEGKDF